MFRIKGVKRAHRLRAREENSTSTNCLHRILLFDKRRDLGAGSEETTSRPMATARLPCFVLYIKNECLYAYPSDKIAIQFFAFGFERSSLIVVVASRHVCLNKIRIKSDFLR